MSFYQFQPGDIIYTKIVTNPVYAVSLYGNRVTGSIYFERPYLNSALTNRRWEGFSEREGGLVSKTGPFTASVDFRTAVSGGNNQAIWRSVSNLYTYYSQIDNTNYTINHNGSTASTVRVITIPEIYYDRAIATGTFSASDHDADGATRNLYDDGKGGIYSGSLSGTLLGNIFYSEGLVVLKASNLSNFGSDSADNFKWRVDFKGTHTIPVNIFRCRAPAGQLNATTNTSFYTIPTSGPNAGTRQILSSSVYPYITTVGLYNEDYQLVGVARLAQPIKKEPGWDVAVNIRVDF